MPNAVELYRVGTGSAPMFAVESGGGFGQFRMAYTAFGAVYRDGRVMIDAAVDRATAETIGQRGALAFDDRAYRVLLDRMATANVAVLTHEHKDHVMALVRNPDLPHFVDRVWIPSSQLYGLLRYANDPSFEPMIRARAVQRLDGASRIAPGIAVASAPGHSPGSLVVYVRLASNREFLFVGDIAWSCDDILKLRTRPRFLQWLMFDPNEKRAHVLSQLRALHDIHERAPELVIVPSHDNRLLDSLLQGGAIIDGTRT